jgi:putative endonuclease
MKPRYRQMLRKMEVRESRAPATSAAPVWSLYILRCGDGSFYTGVTNDLERRLRAHQEGKASRFTRTRRPVEMVYREECGTRSQALTRECAVKSLSRQAKEDLVAGRPSRSRPTGGKGLRGRGKGTTRPASPG